MELDELKLAWQTLDRRLEKQNDLSLQQFREGRLDRLRSGLRPLVVGQILQIVAGAIVSLLFGSFWFDHREVPHLLLYGLVVHAYSLLFIVSGARTLNLVRRLDYAAPVLVIQRQLAELRDWRVRVEGPLFAITGCIAWIPFTLIVLDLGGADVWLHAPSVVYSFIASGVLCLLIFFGLLRRARQPGHGRRARWLADSAIGAGIRRAQAQLDEIARFELD
jgi:hypothetical protein